MDQVPLPFAHDSSRSLNERNQPVFILMPHGSLDKRQASVILCIRASGEQNVRPVIIFR